VELARAVLEAGAPGLHIYTFNKYEPALDLLEGLQLGSLLAPSDSGLTTGAQVGALPVSL
jgi:methylenetetrahydrofolate reductase (NADPH)